ncbi:Hypothetical predicted protein [Octopus vulgaris]|uniref:Uncharacterized protein n=1 Tax=Octopus vulgaris TaxID=6645 RepID=A0AA36BTF1_OCTVU|nr:Hypothetical predicted protein [Octopus vulgaris]
MMWEVGSRKVCKCGKFETTSLLISESSIFRGKVINKHKHGSSSQQTREILGSMWLRSYFRSEEILGGRVCRCKLGVIYA